MCFLRFFSLSTLVIALLVTEFSYSAKEEVSPDEVKDADQSAQEKTGTKKSDRQGSPRNTLDSQMKFRTDDEAIEKKESVNLTVPAEATGEDKSSKRLTTDALHSRFYQYQSSMAPRLGILSGSLKTARTIYFLGVSYMMDSETSRHREFGASLLSDGTGIAQFDYRWIFYPTELFRPYTKAGLELLINPDLGLSNVLLLTSYFMHGCIGFEDVLSDPMSVRFELELGVGASGAIFGASFGYSWAW